MQHTLATMTIQWVALLLGREDNLDIHGSSTLPKHLSFSAVKISWPEDLSYDAGYCLYHTPLNAKPKHPHSYIMCGENKTAKTDIPSRINMKTFMPQQNTNYM